MIFRVFHWTGATAIITGGSGGIGRACAVAFAKAGANIVIASLPPDSIPPVVEEVEALGVNGLGLAVDVTDEAQVKSLVEQSLAKFGRIDALINVAGGSYSRNPHMPAFNRAPLLELAPVDFMTAYAVNTKTAFLCAKAVAPHMKARGKGSYRQYRFDFRPRHQERTSRHGGLWHGQGGGDESVDSHGAALGARDSC